MPLRPTRRAHLLVAGPSVVALGLLAAALPAPAASARPAAASAAAASSAHSVFVWYDRGATAQERSLALGAVRASAPSGASSSVPVTESVPVPAGSSAEAVAESLRGEPGVRFAIPDLPIHREALAPDALTAGLQWGLRNDGQVVRDDDLGIALRGVPNTDIDGPEAWKTTTGTRSTLVGVIDSGIDITHPDLAPAIWTNPRPVALDPSKPKEKDLHGWDFCHSDGSVYDPTEYFDDGGTRELNDLHGTHVAGTIAAANDGSGSVGAAPGVTIVPLKVFGVKADGSDCTSDGIFQALVYAALHGVDVVNASWSIEAADASDRAEIDDLFTALGTEYGMVIVAAAGNGVVDSHGVDVPVDIDQALADEAAGRRGVEVPYPAASRAPNVITVGAVDSRGRLAPFSNYGHHTVDVLAPGVSIWSTVPGALSKGDYSKAYGFLSGTSMATPHVTAEAALLRSSGTLPADEIVRRIETNGKPLRALPPLVTLTNDMADPYRALRPASAIRVTVAPPSVRTSGQSLVTATLSDGVSWKPRARQLVTPCFRIRGTSTWSCARAVRTDASGRAAVRVRPGSTLDVQWRFRGVTGAPAVSSDVVVVGVTRGVSLSIKPSSVRQGQPLRATGRVTDTGSGAQVLLQRFEGERWRTLLIGTTRSDGSFGFTARLSLQGTWKLRAYVPAGDGFTHSASSPRALRVR
ncbi:subtilase family protein [Motilibacter peucedani]|uniref:Subtilase family protein n=1 Tax=Motilibacter peucedani TaxID=598650 RepID=A0A420XNZ0_9ACTN|nr:S8 family serine peptidase [Motilibacter peucedani]RKS73908.1 subtilase family protein [Motilibacter peucedani]